MSLKLTLALIETSYATKAWQSPFICAVVVKALELKSNSKLGAYFKGSFGHRWSSQAFDSREKHRNCTTESVQMGERERIKQISNGDMI